MQGRTIRNVANGGIIPHWLLPVLIACSALTVGGAGGPASAGDYDLGPAFISELRLGGLYHDAPGLWSGFQRERGALDINVEVLFAPLAHLFGGTIHPAAGGTINTQGDTSKAYLDARWHYETSARVFLALGLGAAIHDGNLQPVDAARKALGSRWLFHPSAEIGYRIDAHNSVSVYFDHMSNAYTSHINEGLDTLGLRYGYRF